MPPAWIKSGARCSTATEISNRAQKAAGGLSSLGVGAEDVVALLLRNDFSFFEASLAAGQIGAYATPINWHSTREEVQYILSDSGAKVLIAHDDLLTQIGEKLPDGVKVFCVDTPPEIAAAYGVTGSELPECDRWEEFVQRSAPYDGPAIPPRGAMIYTSGTTGRPKGVRRAAASAALVPIIQQVMAKGYGLTPGQPMTVLMNGPMYHSAPNSYARAALMLGANFVLQPKFDAEDLLVLIETHRITHMHIVPTMFHRLLKLPAKIKAKYDLSSLVDVVHGAAPCPPDTKRAMIEWWGPVISEYYGSTETALVARATSEEALAHPGSVGKALPGCELQILGPDREPLPPGSVGDIYVRNGNLPGFAYHGDPAKFAEIEANGFVTAGDVGYMDSDGFLYLSDRKKDMIISGGVNIYPAEIEAALLAIAGIKDCAVFGGPDEEFGECVIAHIEQEAGCDLDAASVRDLLSDTIAKYKIPRVIEFATGLPREDSGKIFKRKLREPYWRDVGRRI